MTARKPLGAFLSEALGRPSTSQASLARELGVTRSTVHLWASGKRAVPEHYRAELRKAARGQRMAPPPPRTTKSGAPVKKRGKLGPTQTEQGRKRVDTNSIAQLGREVRAARDAGTLPNSFTLRLKMFESRDSSKGGGKTRGSSRGRDRVITVRNLTPEDIAKLARGQWEPFNQVVRERYFGNEEVTWESANGFTFTNNDTPPPALGG